MKTITFKRTIIFIMAVFLMAGINVNAQRGYGKRGSQSENRGASGLNLSEEQQSQVKDLKLAHMKELQPLEDQLMENKAHQRTLMNAENPDEKAIYKNIDQATKLQNEMAKLSVDFQIIFKNLLNDEQKVMLQSRTNKFGRMGSGRHSFGAQRNGEMMHRRPMQKGMRGFRWNSPNVGPDTKDQ